MKKYYSIILIAFLLGFTACQPDEVIEEDGMLSLVVGISVDVISTGRLAAVNTDDFKVTIYDDMDTEIISYDPFSTAPATTSLPTGTYYVTASSNNLMNAAFEEPFYFGRSANFTIDKEESKTITVNTELTNTQVSVNYSASVVSDFDDYNTTVTLSGTADALTFISTETRSGYFISGTDLEVESILTYTKLDLSVITETLTTTITNPLPKTHYQININAALVDGEITILINVDETVDLVDIDLSPSSPSTTFQVSLGGSIGDNAKSIQETGDGGYIVVGLSNSTDGDVTGNHGNYDYWIVKLDVSGNISWEKSLGGTGSDYAYSIQETSDGGYIVAGLSNSTDGDVTGGHGSSDDYWIVKLDGSGNLSWEKSLGGSGNDYAESIQETSDGGYIVAGRSTSTDGDVTGNHGGYDSWVVKLDASGNLSWEKSLGGSANDYAESIQETSDGGYIVAVQSNSLDGDITGNHGGNDYWVVKLDVSGNLSWEKSLGGTGHDYAYSIQETSDGGYIVAGSSQSSDGDVTGNNGNYDYWVVKLDVSGNLSWQKSLGGSGGDYAYSIQETSDGEYIVAGSSYSSDGDVTSNQGSADYWVVKLDVSGNLSWEKSLGGSSGDYATSIQQTSDGGYIVAGYSESSDGDVTGNHGGSDYWVVKIDVNGDLY
ncbi:MAG: DUF4493 domain-containing protein [Cytophagales bacterium]|nr:DUF4493 domain-containing protein [Cytophagales bacterium]